MYPTISTTPIKTWDNRWRSWLRHHIHSFRSVSIPPNSTLPVFKPGTLAEEDGCWLILFLFFWLITAFHSRVTFCVKLAYSAPFTCLLLSRIRFLWCFLFCFVMFRSTLYHPSKLLHTFLLKVKLMFLDHFFYLLSILQHTYFHQSKFIFQYPHHILLLKIEFLFS